MSKADNAVKITILDKEYLVSCPDDEKEALEASVKRLSQKMSEIRSSGKVVGIDRIAVMAGLNIAHESIQAGTDNSNEMTGDRLRKLNNRIADALSGYRQLKIN